MMRMSIILVLVMALSSVAPAARIPVVSATPDPPSSNAGYPLSYTYDDIGMSGDTHTLADTQGVGYDPFNGDSFAGGGPDWNTFTTSITYDLGQDYLLDEIWIWNWNVPLLMGNGARECGMKDVSISTREDGGPLNRWLPDERITMADGTNANVVDLIVDNIGGLPTRYVTIWSGSFPTGYNYSGDLYYTLMLGTVRFYEVNEVSCQELIEQGGGLDGDLNEDCCVDVLDVELLAGDWLSCMYPGDPACEVPSVDICGAASAPLTHIPIVGHTATPDGTWTAWTSVYDDIGIPGDTHSLADTQNVNWPYAGGLSAGEPFTSIRFDLGKKYLLDEIWVWNYNTDTLPGSRNLGMKNVYITTAEDANSLEEGLWSGVIGIADGTAANLVDLVISGLGGVEARYVTFHALGLPDHNWSGGQFYNVGLGEVRFYPLSPPDSCLDFIDFGYGLNTDINQDCYTNFFDFEPLAKDWLLCVDPSDPNNYE